MQRLCPGGINSTDRYCTDQYCVKLSAMLGIGQWVGQYNLRSHCALHSMTLKSVQSYLLSFIFSVVCCHKLSLLYCYKCLFFVSSLLCSSCIGLVHLYVVTKFLNLTLVKICFVLLSLGILGLIL